MEKFNQWTQLARVKEIKGNELKALIIILDYHNLKCDGLWNNTPHCVIQTETDYPRKTLYRILKSLEDKGVISIQRNVYESADDIVPNIEYINNLINESKMTPIHVSKRVYTYGVKNDSIYGSKMTPNTKEIKTKEISYYNYNNSTRKKNENLDKGLINENEIKDSSIKDSLTKTELNVIEDKGTLDLMEGNNTNEKGEHSPYSGSTNPTQGKYNPIDLIPTRAEDNDNWDFEALFIGAEDNPNDHNPYETQIQAAGKPISIVVGQLPTAAEKHAQNANKVAIRQSKATTDNLTSDDIRTITVQTLREDYDRSKNVLWNGSKFKHLAIAAVEQSNHLLYENGTRLAMVACGTYLHGKVTYLNSNGMTENQRTRLKLALTELGSNIKQYGCADTLKTLQYGCAEFKYTLQYFRV